jgi:DNA-binding NarL/FixJ family response regulator
MLAVAHSLGRKSRAATEVLAQLERSDPKAIPAVKYLVQAVRTFNRIVQGAAERDALDRDLAKVREHGLGGYADLLAALSAGIARTAAFGALTKTESQMLRLIARGGTTKAIAVELNRSPDTVETHVRAILRKLGCKSRSEAVALARDHGIL